MRKYAPYFDHVTNTHKVIMKDDDEDGWYNYIPDAGGDDNAKELSEAMNAREVSMMLNSNES